MTVVAALDSCSRVAITALVPFFSPIAGGFSARVTRGAASSSSMVSGSAAGAATPLPPATAAPTSTVLSGASTRLSTALMVKTPLLPVAPAAIVSTRGKLRP